MQNWKIVKAKKREKWEKSKGKWKERVKRVAVVGMAVATLFSSLAVASGRLETTFADFSGDSDSGGGLIGGLSQGQKTSWNEQQIGIRFYLVDKNGARVSKVVDILRSEQNLTSVKGSNLFMGDRIGGKKPINMSDMKRAVYTEVPAFSGFTAWPVDYTSGPTGRGEAFKGWFLGDGSINAPISKFLRWENGGDFVFKPKGIQMELDPASKPSIEQTMRKHKLSLFAEPILWFTPCTLKPNPHEQFMRHAFIYGSTTDIYSWYNEDGHLKYSQRDTSATTTNYAFGGQFYNMINITRLGMFNAETWGAGHKMIAPQTINRPSYGSFYANCATLPEMYSELKSNVGLGLHIYAVNPKPSGHTILDITATLNPGVKASVISDIGGLSGQVEEITIGNTYAVTAPKDGYDMESQAPSRGFQPPSKPLKITQTAKGEKPEILKSYAKSLETLTSNTKKVNNLHSVPIKTDISKLAEKETIFYYNIWVVEQEEIKVRETGDIRSDELTAALKSTVLGKRPTMQGSAVNCGKDSGAKPCDGNCVEIKKPAKLVSFTIALKESAAQPVPFLDVKEAVPDTKSIIRKQGEPRLIWLEPELVIADLTKQRTYSKSFKHLEKKADICYISHRGGGDKKLNVPYIAEYMKTPNTPYIDYCTEHSLPKDAKRTATSRENILGDDIINFKLDPCRPYTKSEYDWTKDETKCIYIHKHQKPCVGHDDGSGNKIMCNPPFDYDYKEFTTSHTGAIAWKLTEIERISCIECKYEKNVIGTYINKKAVALEDGEAKKVKKSAKEYHFFTPAAFGFTPTYVMRYDKSEKNFEEDKQPYTAREQGGNRTPAWMLSETAQTFKAQNFHAVQMQHLPFKVKAQWSTDYLDKDSKLAVLKAGGAYKIDPTTLKFDVDSTIWLQDPGLAPDPAKAKAYNEKMLKEHTDLVNHIKDAGTNSNRFQKGGVWQYANLDASIDKGMINAGLMVDNELPRKYASGSNAVDSWSESDLKQAELRMKQTPKIETTTKLAGAAYLNKHYSGGSTGASKDLGTIYNTDNYQGERISSVSAAGAQMSVGSFEVASASGEQFNALTIEESKKVFGDGLDNHLKLLHRGKGVSDWYAEDYEGVVCVNIHTTVYVKNLEGDFSAVYKDMSYFNHKKPIALNGTYSIGYVGESTNIPTDENAATGYALGVKDVVLSGHKFGGMLFGTDPFMFEIRSNIYEDSMN